MKIRLSALIFTFCLAALVLADRDDYPCESDLDCKRDECCVLSFTGARKVCKDIGDDWGDECGGPYFCSGCRRGLVCKQVPSSRNPEPGCGHPANATCEPSPEYKDYFLRKEYYDDK